MKRLIVCTVLLMAAAHAIPVSAVEYQQYGNETQFAGGAYVALSARPAIVEGLTHHCAGVDRTTRKQARATQSDWESRNAGYAPLHRRLRAEARDAAKRANALHELRAIDETTIPVLIQTTVSLHVHAIDSAPAEQRAARCSDLLRQIDDGRMDLAQEPAGLGVYIEQRRAGIAAETGR